MRTRAALLAFTVVVASATTIEADPSEKGPFTPAERVRAAGEIVQAYDLEHSIGPRLRLGLPIEELPDITPAGALRDLKDTDLGPDDADSLAILRHMANDAITAERFAGLMTPVTPYSSPLRSV